MGSRPKAISLFAYLLLYVILAWPLSPGFQAQEEEPDFLAQTPQDISDTTAPALASGVLHMVADFDRPYIYALNTDDQSLYFLNTDTNEIEKILPFYPIRDDTTINYGEGILYVKVSNSDKIRRIDLETQTELDSLYHPTVVQSLNAGQPGRIYTQTAYSGMRDLRVYDTVGDYTVSTTPMWVGQADMDPTGRYYYHAADHDLRLRKFDVLGDTFSLAIQSLPIDSAYLAKLVLSADGSRLFWDDRVYDENLEMLQEFDSQIIATTARGELAIGVRYVYDGTDGTQLFERPAFTAVAQVSGDQKKLFWFNRSTGEFEFLSLEPWFDTDNTALVPEPADGKTIVAPLSRLDWSTKPATQSYRVFRGTDPVAVAAATVGSPEYLGTVTDSEIATPAILTPGLTYHWRVDPVGFHGATTGPVWSFTVAPIRVAPNRLEFRTVTGAPAIEQTLTTSAEGAVIDWTLTEEIPWVVASIGSGATPDSIQLTIDPTGLPAGRHVGSLQFQSGAYSFDVPVQLELDGLVISQMVEDFERPYIYALHPGTGERSDAYLLFIHTGTGEIERVIPIGTNPTDMTIHYAERRLYVTNHGQRILRRVNLDSQLELQLVDWGDDVYQINAGVLGQAFTKEIDGDTRKIATGGGALLDYLDGDEGNAEVDPEGIFYYDSRSRASNTLNMWYFADGPPSLISSVSGDYGSDRRSLVLSGDGARIFWQGRAFDSYLVEEIDLGQEIYTTSRNGDLAFGDNRAVLTSTGATLLEFDVPTSVHRVSGDQSKLFLYNPVEQKIETIPIESFAGIPDADIAPQPYDGEVIIPPLLQLSWDTRPQVFDYDVFFGTDPSEVSLSGVGLPGHFATVAGGSVDTSGLALELGATYYWRVDQNGPLGTVQGPVWGFSVTPIVVEPNRITAATAVGGAPISRTLAFQAGGAAVPWTVAEDIPWLSVSSNSGVTPGSIELTLDPAGLTAGQYSAAITIDTGTVAFETPIEFRLFDMQIDQLLEDYERPYLYGLHSGGGEVDEAFLVFINTETDLLEKAIPIGTAPTDMTVQYLEGLLYVSNASGLPARRVDLDSQEEVEPLDIGDASKISAGRAGRVYIEVPAGAFRVIDTSDGSVIQTWGGGAVYGEVDPVGRTYYRADYSLSQYNVWDDQFSYGGGSNVGNAQPRIFAMSGDGSRLSFRGVVHDEDLNVMGSTSPDVRSLSVHGEIGIGSAQVFDTVDGTPVYDLPFSTEVARISGDQSKLFLIDPSDGAIVAIPMSEVAEVRGLGLTPVPGDGDGVGLPFRRVRWDKSPFADDFDIYFGEDPAVVANAVFGGPGYYGFNFEGYSDFPPDLQMGQTYYWRVDQRGFTGDFKGPVWSFQVAPIRLEPASLSVLTLADAGSVQRTADVISLGPQNWTAEPLDPWITVEPSSGTGGETLTFTLDTTGMTWGDVSGAVRFSTAGGDFDFPIELELNSQTLRKLIVDRERPYVYGLHRDGISPQESFLVLYNTETNTTETAVMVGYGRTDISINYGDDVLYVGGHGSTVTFDLVTQSVGPDLQAAYNPTVVNAGRTGRAVMENGSYDATVTIVDTASDTALSTFHPGGRADGEIDPSGHYYYRAMTYGGARLSKWDISSDVGIKLAETENILGSQDNLVISADGQRVFWNRGVFDVDLNQIGTTPAIVDSVSPDGKLGIAYSRIVDIDAGTLNGLLPVFTNVSAVSNDGQTAYLAVGIRGILAFPLDGDGDGLTLDNCRDDYNPDQSDVDGDGTGDVCDSCPLTADPGQEDEDEDGTGDVCDICPEDSNPDQLDSDADGLGDACDNCPTEYNPDQSDMYSINGIGDACDDRDLDGAYDAVDNCVFTPNPSQADPDGDGLGSECDTCPNVSNYGVYAYVGCVEAVSDGGQCLDAIVDLRRSDTDGEIKVTIPQPVMPERLVFEVTGSNCSYPGDPGPISFFLNGTLLTTETLFPVHDCTCDYEDNQFITVDDSTLIASVWNDDGANQITIDKPQSGSAIGWVRVHLQAGEDSEEVCLWDSYDYGICINRAWCQLSLVYQDLLSVAEFEETAILFEPLATVAFQDSILPERLDIRAVSDGPMELCVEEGFVRDCDSIVKQGEEEIAINGAACGAPTADAGSPSPFECTSPFGASVMLDGTASFDPNSSPGTDDDIVSYEWLLNFGTSSETPLGGGVQLLVDLDLGEHLIALRVTDTFGESDTDEILVSVVDTTPPELSFVLSPEELWPPNHRLVPVRAIPTTADACGATALILTSIESSELADAEGLFDGDTLEDIVGATTGSLDLLFELRAERDDRGDGRSYAVRYTATDEVGNSRQAEATVSVDHTRFGLTEPLELELRQSPAGTILDWNPVEGAASYNVIRGNLADLHHGGGYIDLGIPTCIEATSLDPSTEGSADPAIPQAGATYFYLAEYIDAEFGQPSSYGTVSAETHRIVSGGGCP